MRENDIFITSFMKCGTTWTQEMVWNIWNNLDIERAKSVTLEKRMPFLELSGLLKDSFKANMPLPAELSNSVSFTTCMSRSESRLIKTHLSYLFIYLISAQFTRNITNAEHHAMISCEWTSSSHCSHLHCHPPPELHQTSSPRQVKPPPFK